MAASAIVVPGAGDVGHSIARSRLPRSLSFFPVWRSHRSSEEVSASVMAGLSTASEPLVLGAGSKGETSEHALCSGPVASFERSTSVAASAEVVPVRSNPVITTAVTRSDAIPSHSSWDAAKRLPAQTAAIKASTRTLPSTTCGSCTFVNQPETRACAMCNQEMRALAAVAPLTRRQSTIVLDVSDDEAEAGQLSHTAKRRRQDESAISVDFIAKIGRSGIPSPARHSHARAAEVAAVSSKSDLGICAGGAGLLDSAAQVIAKMRSTAASSSWTSAGPRPALAKGNPSPLPHSVHPSSPQPPPPELPSSSAHRVSEIALQPALVPLIMPSMPPPPAILAPPPGSSAAQVHTTEPASRLAATSFSMPPTLGVPTPPSMSSVRQDSGSSEPPLSENQERLLDMVLVHEQSVFFTGAAGTGKSRTLRELIRRTDEATTFVTALTGMAATHLPRGTTLHSFAGIGIAKGTKEDCLEVARSSAKSRRNWEAVKILIIDEASMMSKALFEKLEFVARNMRKNSSPFGGVLLCLCGDFFQLPPVSRGVSGDDALFCFESELWTRCMTPKTAFREVGGADTQLNTRPFECCFELMEVFRQRDSRLLELLFEVRHNRVSDKGMSLLKWLSRPLPAFEKVEPTRLFPTNNKADAVNRERLAALPGGEDLEAFYDAQDRLPAGMFLTEEARDQLSSFPRRVELKVGAQVILLKNRNHTLVNGSRGVVEGFEVVGKGEKLPIVRFLSGEVMVVHREDDKKELATGRSFVRVQVPLRLSWAITIHKSQGMSIDFLEVDLKSVFEAGQAYVALSRARTLEGLRVLTFDARRFWTSPKVAEFYSTRVRPI